ncbi:MAG: hypothetical protein NVS3B14_04000 [Ktedonobacteraceae bacterium]
MDIIALLDAIKEKIAKNTGESTEILSVREYTPPFRVFIADTNDTAYCVTVRGNDVTLIPMVDRDNNITWNISTEQKKE